MKSIAAPQVTQARAPIEGALVTAQLERLRRSPAFARSVSLFAFLRFVVEETLGGQGDSLKELVIGDALYGRHAPYDPRIESTVRVEARRLRRKLKEHYETIGRDDPVHIELPVGSYRPCFSAARTGLQTVAADQDIPTLGHEVDLAIMPFRTLSSDIDDRFADGLTDELILALSARTQLRLAPRLSVFQFKDRLYTTSDAARWLGAPLLLHGIVRWAGTRCRVTVEVANPEGCLVWSERFDARPRDRLKSQEALAREIVARLPIAGLRPLAGFAAASRALAYAPEGDDPPLTVAAVPIPHQPLAN